MRNSGHLMLFSGEVTLNHNYATSNEQQEALHNRTIRTRLPESFSTLLYLRQGALNWGENEKKVTGPALCFWPQLKCPVLSLEAGANAMILGLSDSLLLDSIGARAESVHLRMLVEQPFLVSLAEVSDFTQIAALTRWFHTELLEPNGQSQMMLAAYIRLAFIRALRLHQPGSAEEGAEQTGILRRFRHLVELHYRDHWRVMRYAQELNIDYDRLHRICKRETKRSPAELVHERLTAEAKARLENSGYPLKKIASELGFVDATRFSHFFKRRTEMSPGAYRAIVSRPDGEDLVALKQNFSDWP